MSASSFRPIVLLAVLLLPAAGLAAPPTDCNTPRNAVESLLGWQQPGTWAIDLAARCLDPVRAPTEREMLARRIKEIYDWRNLYVQVDRLPNESDYVDPETGRARVTVHPELPELYVERQADGQWRWPDEVLARVDRLHVEASGGWLDELVRKLPRSLRGTVFGVELWQYGALALLALVGLLLRKIIQFLVGGRIRQFVDRFGQVWATKLIAAVDSPGATLAMAGVLAISYPELKLPIKAALAMQVAVRLLAVVSVVWAAYRLVDVFAEALAFRAAKTASKLDDQLVPLVRRSLKIATVILGGLFVLQNLDVDVGSLLAGLGIGGIGIALAAKDTLANFFGSIMIFADRPFQIGDWVQLEGGTEGIVEEVGFRSTRIRTFYNSLVTVPNSKVADAKVDNYGARRYRRTYTSVRLPYETTPEQIQAFVEGVRAILRANPWVRKDYYEVHLSGFGPHALEVMLYFFFEVPTWSDELRERHNVFLEILRLAASLGIRFALPTSTVHLESVAQPGAPREIAPALTLEEMARVVNDFGPGGARARPGNNEVAGGWYAQPAPPAPREPAPAAAKKSA